MSEEQISTLAVLLDKYKVEIPIVQRDYAQGRRDNHAKTVRFNLLRDIKAAVIEGTPLDLSFIYGKEEDGKFIPVDGQQRLTTLFLLHLYAFCDDDSKTDVLYRFTYETRVTSREFLRELIKNRAEIFAGSAKPSDEIEDSEWFVPNWRHDPTVQSALVMLDEIEDTFRDVDGLAGKLTDVINAPVTFQFLNMKDLGMEDSLYIKLNARGKPLTEFENFKAQLIGRIKKLALPYTDEFERHFDYEWTDLFWKSHKEEFDKTYYAFFGVLLMNHNIICDDKNWEHGLDYGKINRDIFDSAFFTLNYLCQNPADLESRAFIFDGISEGRTYVNRILFHALTIWLLRAGGVHEESMKAWMRIIKNLALNSDIDNLSRYRDALDSVNALADHWNDPVRFFANKNKVTFFSGPQIKEEQRKAAIITASQSFAAKIYEAEKHPYFSGQIRSALYPADKGDGTYDEAVFESRWLKISRLFEGTKPKYGDLLRRALLTFGDYTLPVSQFKTLCVDDPNEAARTPSLKALFSDCGKVTGRLLDKLDAGGDIKSQLEQMIAGSKIRGNDWRYCFIQYPQLFCRMSISHLRLRELNGKMHIIQNKWANGYNYDLFLTALQEELRGREISSQFDDELGTLAQHCLYVKDYTIAFNSLKFQIKDKTKTVVFETQSDDPISEAAVFLQSML